MDDVVQDKGKKLLLMGSKAFQDRELPEEVKQRIDAAIEQEMTIIVGEAKGACRLYQDHLQSKNYHNVIVGHARSLRYNAGNWPDIKYGDNLRERERNMVEDCDTAIAIWMNKSSVIAGNLERLKWLGKPTFFYECSSYNEDVYAGHLDQNRIYEPFLYRKLRTKYGKAPGSSEK
ncbi:MAG: hypothetical protein ACXACF_02595 [Candidatus Hermodarchaeia archaeon]|jgi:hypothetical protein